MDQRVVTVPLRQLDPRGLEALQGDRVAHPRERVAQRLERRPVRRRLGGEAMRDGGAEREQQGERGAHGDRKSTRLNSSHLVISYAVFCLKKKKSPATTSSSESVSLSWAFSP